MSTFNYLLQRELSIHAGSGVSSPPEKPMAHRTPVGRGMNEGPCRVLLLRTLDGTPIADYPEL